jgi:hypothetical protein
MHKILLSIAAAGVLFAVLPAAAEDVDVSIGHRGVAVGVDHDHDRIVHRHIYTEGHGVGCREVTVKKRMPDGSVVVRKSQRC